MLGILFLAGLALGTGAQLYAFHRWGCYHWPWPTANGRVDVGYRFGTVFTNRDYRGAFLGARNVWNTAPPTNFFEAANKKSAKATWSASAYGFNGWLGLATIYINGCVITKASSKINDTYMQSASYSQTNIDHVACQEVGHTLGLDHNRNATNTCMNDTILTVGNQINQHDRDELDLVIYP